MNDFNLVVVTEDVDYEVFLDLKRDCTLTRHPICFVYAVDEDGEEGAIVGCIYADGSCSVVGLNRDQFCTIDEMIRIVRNSL